LLITEIFVGCDKNLNAFSLCRGEQFAVAHSTPTALKSRFNLMRA
jgi:hypothetical protein